MITDNEVERAVKYLRDSSEDGSRLRGLTVGLNGMTKSILADQYFQSPEKTAAASKEFAYKTSAYKDHIGHLQNATQEYEVIRLKREAAHALIEAWRTQSSNNRQGHL